MKGGKTIHLGEMFRINNGAEDRSIDKYSLLFDCPDGIPGNSNHDITRYHGWRGTTDDVSCYAHGLREIVNIRELKNGRVAVTVGPDLTPEED